MSQQNKLVSQMQLNPIKSIGGIKTNDSIEQYEFELNFQCE